MNGTLSKYTLYTVAIMGLLSKYTLYMVTINTTFQILQNLYLCRQPVSTTSISFKKKGGKKMYLCKRAAVPLALNQVCLYSLPHSFFFKKEEKEKR